MRTFKYLTFTLFLGTIMIACKNEYKFVLTAPSKAVLGEKTKVSLKEEHGNKIDSVQFFVNNQHFKSEGTTAAINTEKIGVGKHTIVALAFYPNKAKKITKTIEILSDKEPASYTYRIVNTYPHDVEAYTQGLEFKDGFLYETTGRRGKSSLRKVALETGKVLQKENLDPRYFGEGMTIFKDKIYWLTWQANRGFIYDFNSFKQTGEFKYRKSREGWGLTHNDTELIKSDGTNKIWFLNPEDQREKRNIKVYTNKYPLDKLNEIEYVNGKIYANKWQRNAIVIIDPATGVVDGVADLSGLKKEMEKTQDLGDEDEVLNGIAYDKETNRLFVTGKHWGKLFEIELIKK
ncbi:Putative glutamine cyclotransferase precursor [Tenacibaculum maritimum]|uniref:glutaminyl-peptide cyclotransferase n=1 Tax=Tenacibaculum maritimum TaxID=107401 RepID=UPI0012E4BFBE|nr:glutaminyl-peptide cyclotransferase [Tenacibaculum maritimum]CAA0258345.1 Putative glutamine cyclotransferase precursor [Tenacibaculum maritimum]